MGDKAVKIAVVGLRFGGLLARIIREGDTKGLFELAAVCDLDEKRAQEHASRHGVRAFTDLDAVLADPEIPAICLMTGPNGRADLVRRIIRAGKDIMTTKPFERDPQKALDVLLEAKRLGRVVHMNSPSALPSPERLQIDAWRKEFDLGAPVACRLMMHRIGIEKADGTWYDDPDLCPAAPLFRLGIHLINNELRAFGEVESVQVMASRILSSRPTPDNAQLSVRFKNGALGSIFCSFCTPRQRTPPNRLMMYFQRGMITSHAIHQAALRRNTTKMTLSFAATNDETPTERQAEIEDVAFMDYQWDNFYRAIHGEKLDGETTPEEIVHGLKILDAMARAEKSGGTEMV